MKTLILTTFVLLGVAYFGTSSGVVPAPKDMQIAHVDCGSMKKTHTDWDCHRE